MFTPANKPPTESFLGESQELVPGIRDDITLLHIVPRLPWKVFYILSSVSRAWHHAIQTRQVYDARVVSQSREMLVVASFSLYGASSDRDSKDVLASLYSWVREDPLQSKRDEIQIRPASSREDPIQSEYNKMQVTRPAFRRLPPIPCDGNRWTCSDGYIFFFGVEMNSHRLLYSKKVFVFDVAGQRSTWRVSASMIEGRRDFAFSAIHGKLYVFGGLASHIGQVICTPFHFCGSEVYDPKEDRWSQIKSMPTLRYGHRVDSVGDEFFVHGGRYFDLRKYNTTRDANVRHYCYYFCNFDEDNPALKVHPWLGVAEFPEAYNPVKDEWRVVNPFGRVVRDNSLAPEKRVPRDYLFVVEGKLYSIDWSSIHMYAGENSWTHLHSFSFPIYEPDRISYRLADSLRGKVTNAIVIDGQLFVKVDWWITGRRFMDICNTLKFQTVEFAGESKKIIWKGAPDVFIRRKGYPTTSTQVIQL